MAGLKCQRIAETDDKELQDEDSDADYIVEEKGKHVTLTPKGIAKAEAYFNIENLSDAENTTLNHHINQAIRARGIMKRDVDYVVKDGQVIIVDEFTGRLMFGRRYNEGLHQAIEAKEGVTVANESKTLATITFQNYFRLYNKLSGMTGTAMTEEDEFNSIYNLDIVEIPTNKPVARVDDPGHGSIRPRRANTGRSSPRSRTATPRGSRCWWALCPSRSPSCSAGCWTRKASSTASSMPSSTTRRRRSSPRPASWGR